MAEGPGFHRRGHHIASQIRTLLTSFHQGPSEYDGIASKIEFWIEYVLRERFMTVDELAEGVSSVAWDQCSSYTSAVRFLKEFRDAPHRSEQARSFVDKLWEHVLRWFAIAAAEDLSFFSDNSDITSGGGKGFIRAASFVGYLIECGVLGRDLVQRHLVKPLIAHRDVNVFRAGAIYQLFYVAGNLLLRGFIEPEDVKVCFETLTAQIAPLGKELGLRITEKLQVCYLS